MLPVKKGEKIRIEPYPFFVPDKNNGKNQVLATEGKTEKST